MNRNKKLQDSVSYHIHTPILDYIHFNLQNSTSMNVRSVLLDEVKIATGLILHATYINTFRLCQYKLVFT